MALSLKSTGGAGHGVSYTAGERLLVLQVLTACLALADITVKDGKSDKQVDDLVAELSPSHTGVDMLSRAAFRGHIKSVCGTGKEFIGNEDFPKQRDPTSIQLLFRAGCDTLGVDKATKDTIFPRYGAGKDAAA